MITDEQKEKVRQIIADKLGFDFDEIDKLFDSINTLKQIAQVINDREKL